MNGGGTSEKIDAGASTAALPSSERSTPAAAAVYAPRTRLEPYHYVAIILLALTVLLGTLTSLLFSSPSVTSFRGRLPATSDKISFNKGYLPGALSSLPLDNLLPNYFANKRNVFNVIFVKKAWLWTTLAWFAHWVTGLLARTEALSGPTAAVAGKEWRRRMVYRPLARYIAATIAWLLFTTWFFGPSLSDRVLVFSGAQCVPATLGSASPVHHQAMAAGAVEAAVSGNSEVDAARAQSINDPNHVVDSSHCYSRPDDIYLETAETGSESIKGRKANVEGGRAYWRGGHDISGHSFLLTLSSLLLLTEIAPTLSVLAGGSGGSSPSAGPAGVTPTLSPAMMRMEQLNSARKAATIFTLAIVGIWWWMLLMTSLFFHTPQEKISGFLVGTAAWWASWRIAG